ncbi:GNAT family N-acetyltransferase [Butyrivibrio sp. WCD3002]|jgi:RimJ/RimL family protein N-acetyltransferase|uniref:GNAT family N-acetyltransferase n=1 Tax=Butyrivibrio sp. WCD3002 TaxID=1280676 RepID=UPI0003FA56FA|nr:GNAT family N-acetyltransferase [Butyrivibrio sp. WCD3002]
MVKDGTKVFLRKITYDDTPLIVKWRNNERVRNNFIYREVFTEEGHNSWMKNQVETGEAIQLIICEKTDGRPVGSVYLRDVDMELREAEYGIFIGEDDALGKGYGNEAATLMCDYAKDEVGLRRLILRVFTDNEPARKSYEHAGFVKMQALPDVECSDGEVRDMILMEKKLTDMVE